MTISTMLKAKHGLSFIMVRSNMTLRIQEDSLEVCEDRDLQLNEVIRGPTPWYNYQFSDVDAEGSEPLGSMAPLAASPLFRVRSFFESLSFVAVRTEVVCYGLWVMGWAPDRGHRTQLEGLLEWAELPYNSPIITSPGPSAIPNLIPTTLFSDIVSNALFPLRRHCIHLSTTHTNGASTRGAILSTLPPQHHTYKWRLYKSLSSQFGLRMMSLTCRNIGIGRAKLDLVRCGCSSNESFYTKWICGGDARKSRAKLMNRLQRRKVANSNSKVSENSGIFTRNARVLLHGLRLVQSGGSEGEREGGRSEGGGGGSEGERGVTKVGRGREEATIAVVEGGDSNGGGDRSSGGDRTTEAIGAHLRN
ncbi:hypothetical protein Sjap_000948 [Stephania japonica]|uniref:Uncharacterized protein n=1 Tax=Stephania japonica TaxID=461633 RepID=A0AAP0KKM1_9MAGN